MVEDSRADHGDRLNRVVMYVNWPFPHLTHVFPLLVGGLVIEPFMKFVKHRDHEFGARSRGELAITENYRDAIVYICLEHIEYDDHLADEGFSNIGVKTR